MVLSCTGQLVAVIVFPLREELALLMLDCTFKPVSARTGTHKKQCSCTKQLREAKCQAYDKQVLINYDV